MLPGPRQMVPWSHSQIGMNGNRTTGVIMKTVSKLIDVLEVAGMISDAMPKHHLLASESCD